ncbi:MAG: protein kinase [Gammaproteobacteria bacterium]
MADFKTALQALSQGKIKQKQLSKQLHDLLTRSPQLANRMLVQLDEALNEALISDKSYADLKRQINDFRRANARLTEAGDELDEQATVFSRPETVIGAGEEPSSEDPTERRELDDEDATERHEVDSGDEKTVMDSSRDDIAAEARAASDMTGGDTSDIDFDISAAADPSAPPSISGTEDISGTSSPSTGKSWTPPGGESSPELSGLGPGSVIKERFILDAVLGTGGMGKVYKGRDLLKVEAKDKNPYVALKVLNEDFKEHPEAFISLQRESSRQQRLAHPNIATVYDFDRIGRSGTQVFITMELMEGDPLNTFIKKVVKPKGGLPFEQAFPMVRDMAAALAYAHKQNIVHSDFKPGNTFLCNDGTVKVLDFGIARAVKNPMLGEGGGEKTLFDPGKLGALTPAYASLEMLEGEEPDTRDDIYALACVTYELLTGRHPFNKLPATSARENNLVPAPIKGLNRRQMKGLMHGLAFERKKRSPDVETFIEEFEGKANLHKNPYAITGALLLAMGIGGYVPVTNYLHEQELQRLIGQVNTGQPGQIESVLGNLDELSASDRATIADQTRDVIQTYFEDQINRYVNPEAEVYNFQAARNVLKRAEELYPDSAALRAVDLRLSDSRNQRLYDLNKLYIAALEQNKLIPGQDENDVRAVLNKISRIDPQHPLLEDPRLSNAYSIAAEESIEKGDFKAAQEFLDAGLSATPDDVSLVNLQDELASAIAEIARQERVVELDISIRDTLGDGKLAEVAALKPVETEIIELAEIAPEDPLLDELTAQFEPLLDQRINTITSDGDRAEAETFTSEYSGLMQALRLNEQLVEINLAHLEGAERDAAVSELAAQEQERIDTLLAEPQLGDPAWDADLQARLLQLDILLPEDSARLAEVRQQVADVFTERATELQSEKRFSEALSLLDRADRLVPDTTTVANVREQVSADEAEFQRQREEATRQARIAGLKETLLIQARAKDVVSAQMTLEQLREDLPADDEFLTGTAAEVMAEAYTSLAESRANQDDYQSAKRLAQSGLEIAPDNQTLQQAMQEYTVQANSGELEQIFANAISFDLADVNSKIEELRTYAPDRYGQLQQQYINTLTNRVNSLRNADPTSASRLVSNATRVFPNSQQLQELQEGLAPEPWDQADQATAALENGRLSQANTILATAMATNPDHPDVLEFRQNLENQITTASQLYDQYLDALANEELETAQDYLNQARDLWRDNAEYNNAVAVLERRMAPPQQESRVLQREQDISALDTDEAAAQSPQDEPWEPIASDRECATRLASYGRRARAICYDLIHARIRGPLMVVVPGTDNQPGFAISKYEVSLNDYNKYCYLSGDCEVSQAEDRKAPLTGISIEEATRFTEWLSDRTGKTYRLPTVSEWEYAANADGAQPPKDFNCRVSLGDQVLKGTGTVSVTIGHQNGWGLKNYVGNVQEWVRDGNSLYARGGAYSDAHSNCELSLQRSHNGQPDTITGLRLLLEEVKESET